MGKLYVSPASTEDKIREVYEEVSAAVEDKLLTDAPSRNALYKIHVSLGKIVNTLGEQDPAAAAARRVSSSRSVSVAASVAEERPDTEDRTVVPDAEITQIKEEDDSDEGTVIHRGDGALDDDNDSLVDELLDDTEL